MWGHGRVKADALSQPSVCHAVSLLEYNIHEEVAMDIWTNQAIENKDLHMKLIHLIVII